MPPVAESNHTIYITFCQHLLSDLKNVTKPKTSVCSSNVFDYGGTNTQCDLCLGIVPPSPPPLTVHSIVFISW